MKKDKRGQTDFARQGVVAIPMAIKLLQEQQPAQHLETVCHRVGDRLLAGATPGRRHPDWLLVGPCFLPRF